MTVDFTEENFRFLLKLHMMYARNYAERMFLKVPGVVFDPAMLHKIILDEFTTQYREPFGLTDDHCRRLVEATTAAVLARTHDLWRENIAFLGGEGGPHTVQ